MLCDDCMHKIDGECQVYLSQPEDDVTSCSAHISSDEGNADDKETASRTLDELLENHRKQRARLRRKAVVEDILIVSLVALTWYVAGKTRGVNIGYKKGLESGKLIGRYSLLCEMMNRK